MNEDLLEEMPAADAEAMTILAATDGSGAGTAAVTFAARLLATHPSGTLIVLTVERGRPELSRRILEIAERGLRVPSGRVQLESISASPRGDVPEAISRAADRFDADLIVVGSEGRETLSEWVVGGTALRLIYISRRPVTVVRAPRRRRPSAAGSSKANPDIGNR